MIRKFQYFLMYLRQPSWDSGITPPEVLEFISSTPPGRALDLGCGTGTNAITLAQSGWDVTGIDFVGKAIRVARRKARLSGVKVDFIVVDVNQWDQVDGFFDLVLDIGCFHSFPPEERSQYIHHVNQVLKPGGVFLLYAFIHTENSRTNIGVSEQEVQFISSHLRLEKKQTGSDRGRQSGWFTFRKLMLEPDLERS